jgi:hypothetical protein
MYGSKPNIMRNLIVVFGTEKVIVITRGVIIVVVRIMKWPVVVLVILLRG